jgi:hypothetical protein
MKAAQRRNNRESGHTKDFGGAYGGNDRCRGHRRDGLSQVTVPDEENPGWGNRGFGGRRSSKGEMRSIA